MTTEDDFQAALDANPNDWQSRLVFADWLQERGDPRADGYRALGVLRKRARDADNGVVCPYVSRLGNASEYWQLPMDWFDHIVLDGKSGSFAPAHGERSNATRREVEGAVALAFT